MRKFAEIIESTTVAPPTNCLWIKGNDALYFTNGKWVSLFKKEDFINITDRFNKHSISLIEAIQTVPTHQRIDGLVITFEDINGDWRIYQFRGDAVDFFDENKWTDLYDYTNYIVKSITPDEEDLTVSKPDKNGNAIVSLKNRVYDESNFSGKGYKILRKNIQTIDGIRKNILTKDMVNDANTIYEIRYDFDLDGEEIQVKEGCVLNFVGGSLRNGIINLQDGIIKAERYKIFDFNLTIKNSTNTQDAFPEWYGAKGDGINDDFQAFSKIFDAFGTISLSNKKYVIDCSMKEQVFYIGKYMHIKGDINTVVLLKNISDNSHIFHFDKELLVENVHFTNAEKNMKGVCLHHLRTYGAEDKQYWSVSSNMILQRCTFEYFDIAVKAVSYSNRFDFCRINYCNVGFYISGLVTDDRAINITNNHFIQCHVNYCTIGVHVDYCVYSIFDNCTSDQNELSYDMKECDTINFISCGMEYNKKLFNMERCACINIIGAWMLIKREGLLTDFKKDYINLKNSDTITFRGSRFKFAGSFDGDTNDSIPQIFTINGFYDWAKVVVLIDDSYVLNYYKGLSLLFDSESKNKVLILSNKGKYISSSRLTLPAPDASMSNVSGIECYNLRSSQKNYFLNGLWRDSLGRTVVDVPYGLASSRPDYLQTGDSSQNTDLGFRYYDFEIRGPIYWNGTRWKDCLGVEITKEMNLRAGTTLQRNTLSMPSDKSNGYLFYDITLGKYVVWAGREWRDMNGVNADLNKNGTSEQRPVLGTKSEGFEYYDTTLKKKILWNGTSWVNMDGTTLLI